MGGRAFLANGLCTPRMTTNVYQQVLQNVETKLRNHFTFVGHPTEAPGKTTHGDLDIVVCQLKTKSQENGASGDFLARILGAYTWKRTPGNSEFHFALPWPEWDFDLDQCPVRDLETTVQDLRISNNIQPDPTRPNAQIRKQIYIQADIRICPTHQVFQWHLFHHSHGDFWAIVGSSIRRFGLTITNEGLMVRIPEIEPHNRTAARIKVTDDPTTVRQFLGLDVDRFWKHFTDYNDIMDYAATCRFHDPAHWTDKAETDRKYDMMDGREARRVAKRDMFAYWIQSYLPAHVDDKPGPSSHMSREDVVLEASRIPVIGRDFSARFQAKREEWVTKHGRDNFWVNVRELLKANNCAGGYAIKGLKREITSEETPLTPSPSSDEGRALAFVRAAYQNHMFAIVLDWISKNWEAVGQRQEALDREISRQKMRAKRERMAQENISSHSDAQQTMVVEVMTVHLE
ncbi:hypothetical protein PV10_02428 [Exophiala mesophila]|uniref:Uncharacterized protein n=1 Tax=Exophiala mesophila TaxID=212818 RepID=A0A0D1ZL59_EXOME|nr:uncharacterized protein PV10_02428 [Exophiala mesophila]KIV94684.1 hypothetical protein PV10_02428 [Exophiala mesophila]